MSEFLYGLADVGGTQQRVEVWDEEMRVIGELNGNVDPNNYEATVDDIASTMWRLSADHGMVGAVSVAVASELDEEGRLMLGGGLTPWNGKNLGADVGTALGLPGDRAGSLNDMQAAAISQLAINASRGIHEVGRVDTLSSGWGGKPYSPENGGTVGYDSPGHVELRGDAKCPCGGVGHNEAYLSGNGVLLNHGVKMKEYLRDPDAASQFVTDLSTAVIATIERSRGDGFDLDKLRWMGGVASGQPVLMARAEAQVREAIGPEAPAWEAVTLAGKAGLHGAFIDARRLVTAA